MVQIGCHLGADTSIYLESCDELRIIAIDLNGSAGARIPDALNNRVVLLSGMDSHSYSTATIVSDLLGQRLVDVLFIDGSHGFDDVTRDYSMYRPMVRNGGTIVFHDIHLTYNCDVPVFWGAIRNVYPVVLETGIGGDGDDPVYGFGGIRVKE